MSKPIVELGGGKWATKTGKLLAYTDHPNVGYFPVEFDVTNSTGGSYVDKDGVLKTSLPNVARIDFSDSTEGALLLEPQSTNLYLWSEDLTKGQYATEPIITGNQLSVFGDYTAFKITGTTDTFDRVGSYGFSLTENTTYTLSYWMKVDDFALMGGSYFMSDLFGTHVYSDFYTEAGKWVRITRTATTSAGQTSCYIQLTRELPTNFEVYLDRVQLEALPIATSYIKTNGTSVTRSADVCNNADVSSVVNNEEGILFVEFEYFADVSTYPGIRMRTIDDQQQVSFYIFNGVLTYYVKSNNVNTVSNAYSVTPNTPYKIAIKYKLNDTVLFVNGTKIATDTVCEMPTSLTDLRFETSGNSMKYKDVRVYPTALTDQELINLTTI